MEFNFFQGVRCLFQGVRSRGIVEISKVYVYSRVYARATDQLKISYHALKTMILQHSLKYRSGICAIAIEKLLLLPIFGTIPIAISHV